MIKKKSRKTFKIEEMIDTNIGVEKKEDDDEEEKDGGEEGKKEKTKK